MRVIPDEIVTIFTEETRRHIRSGGYILFTVAVPILMVALMWLLPLILSTTEDDSASSGIPGEIETGRIGFVDNSGVLVSTPGIEGVFRYDTRNEGLAAYQNDEIDTLYIIPENYLESGEIDQYAEFKPVWMGNWENEDAFRWYILFPQLKARQNSLINPDLLSQQTLIEEQITEELSQIDPSLLERVAEPATYINYRVAEDGSISELTPIPQAIGEMVVPAVFAMLLMFSIITGVGNMVTSIAEEKENRTIEMIITSASPFSIMTGKLLALGAIGLLQSLIWVVVATFTVPEMFDQIPDAGEFMISPGLMITILACYISGYFMSTTIAILIGAISSSTREASRTAPSFTMFGFIPIWFMGFLVNQPDGLFTRLLSYIPLTAPTGILVRLGAGGEISSGEIAAALVGVIVVGLLFLWIAGRIFRTTMLMQGQSITLHNLWTALKNAD